MIIDRFNKSHLKLQTKEWLITVILDQYREIDSILEALNYIETDIEKIKNGQAHLVHDNP